MSTQTHRAVQALVKTDPAFSELCKALYGNVVDADAIYADAFGKVDDTTKRRLTAGASAVGATAGLAGLAYGAHDARTALKAGKKIPLHTKAFVPLEVAGLAGEVSAAHILHGDTQRKGRLVPSGVSKAVTFSTPKEVHNEAKGVADSTRSVVQQILGADGAGRHAKPPGSSGEQVGRGLAHVMNNPKKAALVVGGAAAANSAGKRKGRREGYLAATQGYAKRAPDVEWGGTFSKFDDDKRQAFGFASVVKKDGLPVVDRQGDFVTPEDMEIAAYSYVHKSRKGGDMHKRVTDEFGQDAPHHVSDLIESVVFTPEKCAAMGMPEEVAKALEGHWWVGFQVHDDDTWAEVKKKGRTGFSIHGRGKRADTTLDEIMAG